MSAFRKIKATVLGQNTDTDSLHAQLEEADVPVAACNACENPCKLVNEEWPWPKKFDVDFESQMMGSVKPYRRQVVISTGKADWAREVTEVTGTLAAYLSDVQDHAPKFHPPTSDVKGPEGIFSSESATRLSILNGSHHAVGEDHAKQTTLVFPDYTMVVGISETAEGAKTFWNTALDPTVGRGGKLDDSAQSGLKTWGSHSFQKPTGSHKKRDNRCHIAADILQQEFSRALGEHGFEVNTQLDDPHHISQIPLEDFAGTEAECQKELVERLKLAHEGELDSHGHKRVLILKNSHIGGHRYAGNAIIYTPQGSSVWYGRVSPREVDAIVTNTILGGQVLAPLLRGAGNVQRLDCKSLHDW